MEPGHFLGDFPGYFWVTFGSKKCKSKCSFTEKNILQHTTGEGVTIFVEVVCFTKNGPPFLNPLPTTILNTSRLDDGFFILNLTP